jgi:osmotically-inducible protein OsmY
MRRFFFSLAFLTLAATGPMQASGGDREIAEQIIQRLKVQRDAGTLKGFTLDLKVEEGIVLMRGRVSAEQQKASVMAATEGIEGVSKVVDEITISTAENTPQPATADASKQQVAKQPAVERPAEPAAKQDKEFSFREALVAAATRNGSAQNRSTESGSTKPRMEVSPAIAANRGEVVPAAASEDESEATADRTDRAITAAVVRLLGEAQQEGQLRGFGVDVTTRNGDVWLSGRASNQQHKVLIMQLAQSVSGVSNVIDDITVYAPKRVDSAGSAASKLASNLKPVAVEPAARPVSESGNRSPVAAAAPYRMPQAGPQQYAPAGYTGMGPGAGPMPHMQGQGPMATTAPYRIPQGGSQQQMPAGYGGMHVAAGAAAGRPVPAAPYAGGMAAPRYDQPYMPNYAWPGYAAYPNYAAVTYPQQYSPSAWPYIGPFYPYPQVPLGWRKVSLEWDDGWWFLDFTDR